jgi:hypothetical protein
MLLIYVGYLIQKEWEKVVLKSYLFIKSVFFMKYVYFLIDCDEFFRFEFEYKKLCYRAAAEKLKGVSGTHTVGAKSIFSHRRKVSNFNQQYLGLWMS